MSIRLSPRHKIDRRCQRVFVIAEIGQNHQGSLEMAKKMIRRAKEAGADCVKFQKSCLEAKFTERALSQAYTSANSWGATYGEHKRFLEFSKDEYHELKSFCNDQNILMTASAMDIDSAKFLIEELKVPFLKIGSGDANNVKMMRYLVAAHPKMPLVVSTGMCDLAAVQTIVHELETVSFALLQCTSAYPTPVEDTGIGLVQKYKELFPERVIGYSGHELGYVPTLGAVALGAQIIERHFTLDKSLKGSDHACSLDPSELAQMIDSIRMIEKALSVDEKRFLPNELSCWNKLGKSIVAAKRLEAGTILGEDDVNIKVSSDRGLCGRKLDTILGRKLSICRETDEPILEEHFQV